MGAPQILLLDTLATVVGDEPRRLPDSSTTPWWIS